MSRRLQAIVDRREFLCERSAGLRASLTIDARALGARLKTADRLMAFARSGTMRTLLIGVAGFVAVGRPRYVLKLALRALALWPLVSTVAPRLSGLLATFRRRPGASA